MTDPTLQTAAWAALEASINRVLQYDPGTREAIRRLDGKILAVEITTPQLVAYLLFRADRIEIAGYTENEVTTRIKGPLPGLLSMALNSHTTNNLAGTGIEVTGSTALLSEAASIFGQLDIDWEEPLTQLLGDIAGHQTAQAIRNLADWCHVRSRSTRRWINEFLHEELRALPAEAELDQFYRDVDRLRLDTDRLSARVGALSQQLTNVSIIPSASNNKQLHSEG